MLNLSYALDLSESSSTSWKNLFAFKGFMLLKKAQPDNLHILKPKNFVTLITFCKISLLCVVTSLERFLMFIGSAHTMGRDYIRLRISGSFRIDFCLPQIDRRQGGIGGCCQLWLSTPTGVFITGWLLRVL